jgi:hypothetical protein
MLCLRFSHFVPSLDTRFVIEISCEVRDVSIYSQARLNYLFLMQLIKLINYPQLENDWRSFTQRVPRSQSELSLFSCSNFSL